MRPVTLPANPKTYDEAYYKNIKVGMVAKTGSRMSVSEATTEEKRLMDLWLANGKEIETASLPAGGAKKSKSSTCSFRKITCL